MKALRRSAPIAIVLLLAVLLAACGNAGTQGTPANTMNQGMNNKNTTNNQNSGGMMYATPTPTMNTNNNNMMNGVMIAADMGGNMGAFIHTGKASINGKQISVLMTNKGFAVYYYRADAMFASSCTGPCAQSWPPILAPQGMMAISSSMPLPKHLSVHQTPNGMQVFYDGHAMYTYASDTQPGVATGRGMDMQWYLVGTLL